MDNREGIDYGLEGWAGWMEGERDKIGTTVIA